jgi:hypothetical protein
VNSVRLDFRADCPSIARNQGPPVETHRREIRRLADETKVSPMSSPPNWRLGQPLAVGEFEAVVAAFEGILADESMSFRGRLDAGLQLYELLLQIHLGKVRHERFAELMEMLTASARMEAAEQGPSVPKAAGGAARLFGQWVFLHAIVDTPGDLDRGWASRLWLSWRRYFQSRRFARAAGAVPRLAGDWRSVDFDVLRRVQPAEDESLEPLARSLRIKLSGHAFAGPGYYGSDVISGLTALWLLVPTVGWMARLEAAWAGHGRLSADDVIAGVRRAHRTFGVSPVFARISERLRLRALAQPGSIPSLQAIWGP